MKRLFSGLLAAAMLASPAAIVPAAAQDWHRDNGYYDHRGDYDRGDYRWQGGPDRRGGPRGWRARMKAGGCSGRPG